MEADHGLASDLVEAEVRERQRAVAGDRRQPRPAAAAAASAHLEQVGEVGVQVQVEDQVHLALVVVAHPQQLVQAVRDEARAAHVHAGLRQHVPVRGARLEVGELHGRGVAAVGAGAEQHRLPAGDGELVPAQEPGVAVVEPEGGVLRAGHLTELVGVEEEVALLDREARRPAAAHDVALGAGGGDDGFVRGALARARLAFRLFLRGAHAALASSPELVLSRRPERAASRILTPSPRGTAASAPSRRPRRDRSWRPAPRRSSSLRRRRRPGATR